MASGCVVVWASVAVVVAVLAAALLILWTRPERTEAFVQERDWNERAVMAVRRHKPTYLSEDEHAAIDATYRSYNPGCFVHAGRLYLVARICNWNWCKGYFDNPRQRSSTLVIYSAATKRFAVVDVHPSATLAVKHGIEDPKCLVAGGELMLFCSFSTPLNTVRMCMLRSPVAEVVGALDREVAEGDAPPAALYFRAGELTVPGSRQQYVEKNWMPLLLGGQVHLVYAVEPLTVMRVDAATWQCKVVQREPDVRVGWDVLRGTSSFVDYDGHLVCLVHFHNEAFIYYHAFMRCTVADGKLVVVDRSTMFKFSQTDRVEFMNGLAVDPNGRDLIVTYGVNDCSALGAIITQDQYRALFAARDQLVFLNTRALQG